MSAHGYDELRRMRARKATLNADSPTSKSEALDRLADFVRRQGRPALAEPTVTYYPPRPHTGPLDIRDLPCWYASQCCGEVPSDDNPMPRLRLFNLRRLALAASVALLALTLLGMYQDTPRDPQIKAGATSHATPLNGNGRP